MKAVKIGILALVLIFAAAGIHALVNNHYSIKGHELGNLAVKTGNAEFIEYYQRSAIYNAKTYRAALSYYIETSNK